MGVAVVVIGFEWKMLVNICRSARILAYRVQAVRLYQTQMIGCGILMWV